MNEDIKILEELLDCVDNFTNTDDCYEELKQYMGYILENYNITHK